MNATAVAAIIATIVGLVGFVAADQPVSRERVTAFAARHTITVTAANAAHLVRYLALTRRWRTAGVVAGLAAYAVDGLQHETIGVNIIYGLIGWFAGAVVAELRAATPPTTRRVASLQRRSIASYATTRARVALVATSALCLLVAAEEAMTSRPTAFWLAPLICVAGLSPLLLVVARHVALRQQSADSLDILAADEAIRANSLRTLYAAAATLMLYAAAGPLLAHAADHSTVLGAMLTLLVAVGIPLSGWRLGRVTPPQVPSPAG